MAYSVYEVPNFGEGYNDIKQDVDDVELLRTQSPKSINMDYSKIRGAAGKDTGERIMGADGISHPMNGAVQLIYEGGLRGGGGWVNKRIVVAGGKLYLLCPGQFFVEIGSGFASAATDLIDATHYIDIFIMTDDTNNIKKWDGFDSGNFADLTMKNESAATVYFRAKCVDVFKERLILGNIQESTDSGETWTEYEDRWMWSNAGDPETWAAADYNTIVTKEGDEIVRLFTYGDIQLIFKKYSLHGSTFTGGALDFEWHSINERVIRTAPYSIASTDKGAIYICEEGLQYTDGLTVNQLPIDTRVRGIIKSIYYDKLDISYGVANDYLQQYWLALPTEGSTTINKIIIYDWRYNNWKVREVENLNTLGVFTNDLAGTWRNIQGYTWSELAHLKWNDSDLYPGSKDIIFGKTTGYCHKKGISYSNDGAAYNARHETGWFEPAQGRKTEIMFFQPFWSGLINTEATVEYKVDYESTWRSTVAVPFTITNKEETPFINMRATGRRFNIRVSNDNANEFFYLYRANIHHQPRGLR